MKMSPLFLSISLGFCSLGFSNAIAAVDSKGVMHEGILLDSKFDLIHNGITFTDKSKVILKNDSSAWTLLSESPQGIRLFARSTKVEGDTITVAFQVVDPQGNILSSPRVATTTGLAATVEAKAEGSTDDTKIESRLSKVRYQIE